ncbi:muts domain V-domain-containing protein [Mucor mucedo]|uniref:muts domain V-domain-containing protein n=1 Tax=Mucor mucedo TaxID=29922 RepID=UPI00221F0D6C|nr:muts domain V-domain-containing protein [Mucor mucedo]KAI7897085.1 muts domain V-domain-containing protein [Mucor mucedo]
MMAVQLSTGHVIYDAFQDTFMRSELETRLLHIEPSEMLIADNVTRPTEKLVSHLNTFGEVRIERMDNMFSNDYNSALTFVSDFYASTSLLPTIVELPDIIIKTLACLIRYLDEFKLSSILKNTTFSHFISESHMLLNANTLVNLEIYKNSTNGKEQGSLFSILNHTSTKFGQRLLRRWVGRPLLNVERLNQRIDAVEEIISTELVQKNRLVTLLKKLPDIEKGLCRIHYGKASPKELVEVLNAFYKISSSFSSNEPRFKSDLLNTLLDILPTIHTDVQEYLEAIHPDVENKADFFRSEAQWPEIPKQKNNIKYIEALLQDHLTELKQSTGISNLKYVTVAGIEYLIEVPSKVKVPNQWLKISNTKLVSRYHDKYILQQLKERDQHRELLSMEAEKSYTQFLVDISAKYQDFRQVVSSLAQLDCLLSLSITSSQSNYCKPIFASTIDVKDSRHPIIERKESNYVPNDIQFTETQRAMVLTGPNMGGKSSYVRQIASICIMGQLGSYVPAKSARLSILDAVYTRMGASDNMMRGESTFMVELHETSDIMKHATERSLVILDELGRGTSTHDGQAIAYAVLDYFITRIRAMTLFVTHYPCIGQLETEYPHNVRNCYMSYLEQDESNIVFLYKLVDGIAQDSYG